MSQKFFQTEINPYLKRLEIITNKKVGEIFAGNYKSSFKGRGIEFAELREYEAGDDVKDIDWSAFAKEGKPFIKKYQESRQLNTFLICRIRESLHFTSMKKSKAEVMLQLAAILIFSAFKNNDQFGSFIFSKNLQSFIKSKKSYGQVMKILKMLFLSLQKEKKFSISLNNKIKPWDFFLKIRKPRGICFYLSDDINEEDKYYLRLLNKKHDLVFFHLLDPLEKGIFPTKVKNIFITDFKNKQQRIFIDFSNQKLAQEFKKIRLQRLEEIKKFCLKLKIDRLEIKTNDNLYQKLLKFFHLRQRHY